MVKGYDKTTILRLICLLSVTLSGFKKDEFDYLRKAFVVCYGFDEIATLMNLQDANILRARDEGFNFSKIKKTFSLINEEVRMDAPTDISYVFNGLSPLSVRIIQTLMAEKGFSNMSSYIKALGAKVTNPPEKEEEFFTPKNRPMGAQKRKVMVYFVGGVTFAEVSAIRFLNKEFPDKQFIIATTSIISSAKVLKQLTPIIENNLDKAKVLSEPPVPKK